MIRESKGFTLIELLVVLVVLAISLTFILPHFSETFRNAEISVHVQTLEKNIRRAQYHSIMEGRRYALGYNRSENSYQFLQDNRSQNMRDWSPAEGSWGKPKRLPGVMSLWIRGKEKIYFFPDGNVSETDILVREGSDTWATLHLGRSLAGVQVERKGMPHVPQLE